MNPRATKTITVLLLTLVLSARGSASLMTSETLPSSDADGSTQPAPWMMQGTVRNAAGQPVQGAEVWADNTVYYDMNVVTHTDAQGHYRLALPHDIGTWKPGAHIKRPWGNQVFEFIVYPNDESAFQAQTGAVRNFVWRIQGAHGTSGLGQPVNVYFGDPAIDTTSLELTFTPEGPLIDGSTIQPFTRKCDGGKITDVPVGRYRVSATHAPHGVREALEVQAEGQEGYSTSSLGTFRETSYGIRMEVYLRHP